MARPTGPRPWRTTSEGPASTGSWSGWPNSWRGASTSSPTDEVFRILADPTRRRILDLLAERGEQTVGQLAAEFPDLVASGISKHLMGLRAAGLVLATRRGREQVYRLEGGVLADALAPWLAKYEPYWDDALERLRDLAQGGR
ncbi:MAG: helix-turn-helix transcriptional regulator [Caulobacteraceae bacterium]|nr:helix-turn-helix transcriptional regulator [Caulobacteraceae bacterium]